MSIGDIPGVIAYRFLPFLGYATGASRIVWWRKLSAWALFAALVVAAIAVGRDVSEILLRGPISLAYFAAISLGFYQLKGVVHSGRLPKAPLLLMCAVAYMLIPALVYRSPMAMATIALGWEAMLSAFSYCVDSKEELPPSSRADCLFFILVNPSLVYAERGHPTREGNSPLRGLARLGLGAGAWIAQSVLLVVLAGILLGARPQAYSSWLIFCAGTATGMYFAHSGLASIQIGFAKLVGYEVPERYAYPFLSRSPEEFWRRWNIYLGSWIKRYVFFPVALDARRKWTNAPTFLGAAAAVLASFTAVGLLHDYAAWAQGLASRAPFGVLFRVTPVFLAFGIVLLSWHTAGASLRGLAKKPLRSRSAIGTWNVLLCLGFLHVAFGMIWLLYRAGVSL